MDYSATAGSAPETDEGSVLTDVIVQAVDRCRSGRILALHAGAQEVLAAARSSDDGRVRRPAGADQGLGGGAVHLHAVLRRRCASSASRRSITTARRRWSRTAGSWPPRRRSASRARSTTPRFPRNAIAYCLREAGSALDDVDYVVFYDKPFLKFERLLETYLAFAPRGFQSFRMAMPLWLREKLFQKDLLGKELQHIRSPTSIGRTAAVLRASPEPRGLERFFPSPFDEAAVLTMDGVGEWATTSVAHRPRQSIWRCIKEIHFPHSLGLLYSAFTYYTGFKVNSGEYKVMGLAPYGEPKYRRNHPRPPHRPQARRLVPPRSWTTSTTAPA